MSRLGNFLHKQLKLTYRLHVAQDFGEGQPVIFLHGIASSSRTWKNVFPLMQGLPARTIAIDLLGFGDSPHPDWMDYSLGDHAKAIALTIRKLKLKQPAIVVGHSLGSLIAVELASQNPELVKQLILCSPTIYQHADYDQTLDAYKKSGRKLNTIYFKFIESLAVYKDFTQRGAKRVAKLDREAALELNDDNWLAFSQSINNAVIPQDTSAKLAELDMPIDIIYGKLDILVLSKYYTALAQLNPRIKVTSVTSLHGISERYAKGIVQIVSKYLG